MNEPEPLFSEEGRLYLKSSTNPNGKPRRQLVLWLSKSMAMYFSKAEVLFVCWRKPGGSLLYSRQDSGYAVPVIPDKQKSGIALNVPRQFHLPLGLRAGKRVHVELMNLEGGRYGLLLS